LKSFVEVLRDPAMRWVGDGFPVRTVFSYDQYGAELSPFLLLDYAGPQHLDRAVRARGIGPHPHRGIEKVTIVYSGEVVDCDSTGHNAVVGPGDVQWMTAGAGVVHQEFQSRAFAKTGGLLQMVQLWVNLPAALKFTPPRYQEIRAKQIPIVELKDGAGYARIIAGSFNNHAGPATTFTPVNVWDLTINSDTRAIIDPPEDHTTLIVVLSGRLVFDGAREVGEAEAALLSRSSRGTVLTAKSVTKTLVLTGAPIDEPIVGRGPFVMNTEGEIRQAFFDFGSGRFGTAERAGS
jgi:quercetin 2,3-dioxygenase